MSAPQIIGFDPHPDFLDWDEEDGTATGTWHYDDGSSEFGQLPREYATSPKVQSHKVQPASAPMASELASPPTPAQPPATPAPPAPNRTSAATGGYDEWEERQIQRERSRTPLTIEIPRASRIAFVHNNPGNLKYVGQEGASQGEPAEDGGHWAAFETPEDGYRALHAQVALDARRGLTLGQFVTKYAPPESNDTASYIAQASQALGGSPDTPISSINQERLARFMAQKESSTVVGGVSRDAPPGPAGAAPSAPQAQYPALGAQPNSIVGLPAAQVELNGRPLTQEELDERQRDVMDRTHMAMAAEQQAAGARIQGRNEALEAVRLNFEDQKTNAQRQLAEQAQIKSEAAQNIQANSSGQLDHGRLFRDMSGGQMLLGLLAVGLSSLGQTMQQRAGNPGAQNMATQMLQRAIDSDLEQQKEDKRSRLAHWTRVYGNAEQGMLAARAEIYQASAKYLEAKASTSVQNADLQALALQKSQELQAQGQAATERLQAIEEQKVAIKYQAPPPVKPGTLPAVQSGQIAKVGVEDRDAETRQALAEAYNGENPEHRAQMTALTNEMQQVTKLEQTLGRLEQAYGVRADEHGKYPEQGDYDTNATGPWWNPGDWVGDDDRDRALGDLWATVETDTRAGWKAEPNGEAQQIRLSGINKPKRDAETPAKLRDLREEIERRKHAIMSGTVAPVRAAWKYQNDYPMASSAQSRKRQAAPGEVIRQ